MADRVLLPSVTDLRNRSRQAWIARVISSDFL